MGDELERLRTRIPEERDTNLLYELLDSAREIILSHRYPYGDWPESFPNRYRSLQVDIAEDLYNRIGAAGQLAHSENSISRTWGSEWVSKELLQRITPMCGGLL